MKRVNSKEYITPACEAFIYSPSHIICSSGGNTSQEGNEKVTEIEGVEGW